MGEPPNPDHDSRSWDAADAAFNRLLDLPEAQRQAALDGMALEAPEQSRVRQLLAAHGNRGLLDASDGVLTAECLPESMIGQRFGDWAVQHELGRGGMAVVYAVVRGEGLQRQHAALKLVTVGSLAAHGAHRFDREHAILARLNHPHIAHLYDAGETADGTPWLVMEKVDGERIDRWCDRQRLSVRQRVECMLEVCGALTYAHRLLVVHADLKPANVLVDDQGMVRVLDFGIGRLLDEQLAGETRSQTLALTPDYAAPEQLAGERVTAAADIFGLGAMLYRLLAGHAPRARDDVLTQPTLPLGTRQRHSALRGAAGVDAALDAVLMTALADEPEQRYHSVDALAADLRAWLDNRPVSVRSRSRRYRARKFIARHRFAVLATAAIVLALLAGVATTSWQARQARQQAERAVAVKDFLVTLLNRGNPGVMAGETTAAELLRRGFQDVQGNRSLSPEVRAELLHVIGRSQRGRDLLADAKTSLQAAQALYAGGTVDEPVEQAATLFELGHVLWQLGELDVAVATMRRADTVLQGLSGHPGLRLQRQRVRIGLSEMLMLSGHADEARGLLAALIRRMRADDRVASEYYSYALRVMGAATDIAGQPAAAVPWLRQAIAVMDPVRDKPTLGNVNNDLGLAHLHAGELDQAERAFTRGIEIYTDVYGRSARRTHKVRRHLASVHLRQGHLERARTELDALLLESGAQHGSAPNTSAVFDHVWLSRASYRAGDLAAAKRHALAALAMARKLGGGFVDNNGTLLAWLGLLRFELGADDPERLLGRGRFACDEASPTKLPERWICLARAWRDVREGRCQRPPAMTPAAVADLDGIDRRWRAVYWLLRTRCIDGGDRAAASAAVARLADGAKPPFPAWLRSELRTAGLTRAPKLIE